VKYTEFGQSRVRLCGDGGMGGLASFERSQEDSFRRKTKIICTMGPKCAEVATLVKMIDAGMNVARLNFSHGDHESHGKMVQNVREAVKLRQDKHVAILLDTKGPEIRTGFLQDKAGVKLEAGKTLILTTDYDFKGDCNKIAVSYKNLPESSHPGNIILCADGNLSLQVVSVSGNEVTTTIMNSYHLGERKNVNLPGVQVELPVLQEKDIDDITKFGIPQGVDFVAASFVQTAEDVAFIRETLGKRGRNIKIISKIENEAGLVNFDAILEASDGIMVARGDLGMEIPPEKVFLAQKIMIAKCNYAGKPVVTATQMLESMCVNPRPTRAEASDVANAVLDGTDCVMLSGETAGGSFPVEAVTIMRRVCEEAEKVVHHEAQYLSMRTSVLSENCMSTVEAVCSSAVSAAIETNTPLIIALTETGATARVIAKYRPHQAILAITASETTCRQLLVVRGVTTMLTNSFQGTDSVLKKALEEAKEMGMVKSGDSVVAVHGQKEECPSHTNLLKVVTVP